MPPGDSPVGDSSASLIVKGHGTERLAMILISYPVRLESHSNFFDHCSNILLSL
jgi:hypothetical protein